MPTRFPPQPNPGDAQHEHQSLAAQAEMTRLEEASREPLLAVAGSGATTKFGHTPPLSLPDSHAEIAAAESATATARKGTRARGAILHKAEPQKTAAQKKTANIASWTPSPGPVPAAPQKPAALPKRPKGRLFMGLVIITVFSFIGHQIWGAFFRFQAYGTIVGEVVDVGSPVDGLVLMLHVREGEHIEPGQLLVTIENLHAQQRMTEFTAEQKLAQANLEAQISQLRWAQRQQTQRVTIDYYELWGNFLQEQSKLMELTQRLERAKALEKRGATSHEELESILFSTEGQRGKVQKLQIVLEELGKQVEVEKSSTDENFAQIKPSIARIESLQNEMHKLREQNKLGEIRSPVSGRVLLRKRFTGEHVKAGDIVFELLEDDSAEVVLYMPQNRAELLQVQDRVEVMIEPLRTRVPLEVARIGDQFEPPPRNLQRYYRSQVSLLPVYLRPSKDNLPNVPLRLGCEVRLPYDWPKWLELESLFDKWKL